MDRREILLRAIEVIEERGWMQGARHDEGGSVCLQYAVCIAADIPLRDRVGAPVGPYVRVPEILRVKDVSSGFRWNDSEGRTKEEVIEALRFLADTGMSWDDALDIWSSSQNLPTPAVEPALVAV